MNHETKLEIREEVERRVEQRESIYWKFGALVAGLIVLFFGLLWKVQLSEVRTQVAKQLAEQKVIEARDSILAIKSQVETAATNVVNSLAVVKANEEMFLNRLAGLKGQDNVVLKNDLSKLFVNQTIKNPKDWRKVVLDYEPIPQTVRIVTPRTILSSSKYGHFRVEGNAIIFPTDQLSGFTNEVTGTVEIEYVRKSLD